MGVGLADQELGGDLNRPRFSARGNDFIVSYVTAGCLGPCFAEVSSVFSLCVRSLLAFFCLVGFIRLFFVFCLVFVLFRFLLPSIFFVFFCLVFVFFVVFA